LPNVKLKSTQTAFPLYNKADNVFFPALWLVFVLTPLGAALAGGAWFFAFAALIFWPATISMGLLYYPALNTILVVSEEGVRLIRREKIVFDVAWSGISRVALVDEGSGSTLRVIDGTGSEIGSIPLQLLGKHRPGAKAILTALVSRLPSGIEVQPGRSKPKRVRRISAIRGTVLTPIGVAAMWVCLTSLNSGEDGPWLSKYGPLAGLVGVGLFGLGVCDLIAGSKRS